MTRLVPILLAAACLFGQPKAGDRVRVLVDLPADDSGVEAPGDPAAAAERIARRKFWSLLADFQALGCAPRSWLQDLSPSTPFFTVETGCLQLRPLPPNPDAP